jgi:hypothetical protein
MNLDIPWSALTDATQLCTAAIKTTLVADTDGRV